MNVEERALQIKLAQLQTKVQIWLTFTVTFFAFGGASLIAEWQIITQPIEPSWVKGLAMTVFFVLGILLFTLAIISVKNLIQYQKELDNIK